MKNTQFISSKDDMVAWRRDFHMYPELGFEEVRTSKKIVEILEDWDVEIIKDFCKTAVIAIVKGKHAGPVVGIRADIDALAMPDNTDTEYKSKNPGVCHACGHDVHTAIALGVVKYFAHNKDTLHGTLKVVFQPAEEGPAPGGAKLILDSGKVDDIEVMLGVHTHPHFPSGEILLRRGNMLASGDNFNVLVKGKGGHGAYPHFTKDAMMTAMEIYTAFQYLLAREIDPVDAVVLSVCYFNAGSPKAPNVIQETANFGGTIRCLNNSTRDYLCKRMKEIVDHICAMNSCTSEFDILTVSIALSNTDEIVEIIEKVATEALGKEHVQYMDVPEMGYDDFAYFTTKAKAAFSYFGSSKKEDIGKFSFHDPLFDVDEDCMPLVANILIQAIHELGKKKKED